MAGDFSFTANVVGKMSLTEDFARMLGLPDAEPAEMIRQYTANAAAVGRDAAFQAMVEKIPVAIGNLLASADKGSNQYGFWIKVATAPAPRDDNAQYGTYQNYGWHDLAGRWHPGIHFMEQGMAAGQAAVDAMLGGTHATGISGTADIYGNAGLGVQGIIGSR